jgi:predicted transcriptional regulator
MANPEYTQAQTMRDEGCSLQQIADELGISKTSVHRLLKDESSIVPTVPETFQEQHEWNVPETFENNKNPSKTPQISLNQTIMTESQIQLERLKLELEHKRKMEELSLHRLELENKKREQSLKEVQSHKAVNPRAVPDKSQLAKDAKSAILMKRYHKLVDSFIAQQEDEDWEVDDCESYVGQVEKLMEEVASFAFKSLSLDHEDLLIWNNLDFIQHQVTEAVEVHNRAFFPSSNVSIELDEEEQERVDELSELDSFDEMFEEEE